MNGSQNANLCIPCGREYANIKQHNDDVHNPNKQPVTCPICEKTFASKNRLYIPFWKGENLLNNSLGFVIYFYAHGSY